MNAPKRNLQGIVESFATRAQEIGPVAECGFLVKPTDTATDR